MNEIILCKLGEVVLKGLNRRSFEMKLMQQHPPPYRPLRQVPHLLQAEYHLCGAGGRDLRPGRGLCRLQARCSASSPCARAVACAKDKEAILETAKTYLGDAAARRPAASRWRPSGPTSPSP